MYFRSPIFLKSDLWKQISCSFHSKPFSIILQPAVKNAVCHSLNGFLYNHFKVQDCYHKYTRACVCAKLLQLCQTLSDAMDCSPPGSSVHGILQARILEWVAMPCSRGIFPTQGSNPHLLHCRRILYRWATREAQNIQATLPKIMRFKKRLQCPGRVLCPSSTYVFVE